MGSAFGCATPGRSFSFPAGFVRPGVVLLLGSLVGAGEVGRPSRLLLLAFLASTSPVLVSFGPILDLLNKLAEGDFFPRSDILRPAETLAADGLLCDAELPGRRGMLEGNDFRDFRPRDGVSLARWLCLAESSRVSRRHGRGAGLGDASMPPGDPKRSLSSSSFSASLYASAMVKRLLSRMCPVVFDLGRERALPPGVEDTLLRSDAMDAMDMELPGLATLALDGLRGFGGLGLTLQLACLHWDLVLFSLLAVWAKSGFLDSRLMLSWVAAGFPFAGGDGRASSLGTGGRAAAPPFIMVGVCYRGWAMAGGSTCTVSYLVQHQGCGMAES